MSKEEISRRGRRGVKGKGEWHEGQLPSAVWWATQMTVLSLPWFSERPRWMWMRHERVAERERERERVRGRLLWPETLSNCCLLNPPCRLPLPRAERLCCTCWPDFACECVYVYLYVCGRATAYVCLWGRLWWWHCQTLMKSWWVFLCHRVCLCVGMWGSTEEIFFPLPSPPL